MDARNFWCLTVDIAILCGVTYTFMPQFLALQKSPTRNTNFLRHNQAKGIMLISHGITPWLIICTFHFVLRKETHGALSDLFLSDAQMLPHRS